VNTTLLKAKLHGATVTDANLNYRGSITIDDDLLECSGIREHELVHVVNINNGARFETYAIRGDRGSGTICLNGAAARLVQRGDKVIILAYASLAEHELADHAPRIVILDASNRVDASSSTGLTPASAAAVPAHRATPEPTRGSAAVTRAAAPATYLSSIAHELGELRGIDSIGEMKHHKELLADLLAMGLSRYSHSDASALALAAGAARKTIARSGLRARDIDAVIYATTSFQDEANYRTGFAQFVEATGLADAYIVGLSLSECANVNLAAGVAADMIASGAYHNVLVVSADVTHPSESRIVPPGISIKSDAAVSFLASRTPRAGFRLIGTGRRRAKQLWGMNPTDDPNAYLEMVIDNIGQLVKGLLDSHQVAIGDLAALITNNYNPSVLRTLSYTLGVPSERLYERNIAKFAHAVAGDTLINAASYVEDRGVKPGERVLLLGTGPFMWIANLLEPVDGAP
jgi:aspartate 1-decarboxylase